MAPKVPRSRALHFSENSPRQSDIRGHELWRASVSGQLLDFTAEVLVGNEPVFRLFKKMGFDVSKRNEEGVYEMLAVFR